MNTQMCYVTCMCSNAVRRVRSQCWSQWHRWNFAPVPLQKPWTNFGAGSNISLRSPWESVCKIWLNLDLICRFSRCRSARSWKKRVWAWFFGATICKMVCPMPSVHCLSVYPVGLFVTLVYCGQTLAGSQWDLACRYRPRALPHCVRWGPSSPSPKVHCPQFLARVCCGETAA